VSRQTAAALAAIVGLLVGLGTLAGVVLALRDEGGSGTEPPAGSDTGLVDTGLTGEAVVTEPSAEERTVQTTVEGFPNALAVGNGGVWVVRDGRRIFRLDPKSGEVNGRIGAGDELGSERPCGVAVGQDAVWVATLSGKVARIGTRTARLSTLIDTGEAACVTAGAGGVWVTAPQSGKVVRIDPSTNQVVAEIPLDGFPEGITVGAGSVWVAASDPPDGANGAVSRIDPRSNEIVRTILVPNLPEFLDAGAGGVWVTSNNGTVAEIDPRMNQLVATVRISDGGRTTLAVGGNSVWASEIVAQGESAPVVRIDPQTAQVAETVLESVGSPLGMAFGAGALWITNYDQGTVTRYQPLP
jgi:virginiamycin B lyase